jgi:hypothetical protein
MLSFLNIIMGKQNVLIPILQCWNMSYGINIYMVQNSIVANEVNLNALVPLHTFMYSHIIKIVGRSKVYILFRGLDPTPLLYPCAMRRWTTSKPSELVGILNCEECCEGICVCGVERRDAPPQNTSVLTCAFS